MNHIKYSVQYQYRPKDQRRPLDDGELVPVRIDRTDNVALLPNIGDHVCISATDENLGSVFGMVASRLFAYQQICSGEVFCNINIVLDECGDDVWPSLIKE